MVGNIGTGKTTTTSLLMTDAAHLNNRDTVMISADDLATALFNGYYGPDIWTDRHIHLYMTIKQHMVREAFTHCFDVIVDGTHMGKTNRKIYIDIAKEFDAEVVVYLHTYPNGLRRRIDDPKSVHCSSELWTKIHHIYKKAYEKPALSEGINQIIKVEGYGTNEKGK